MAIHHAARYNRLKVLESLIAASRCYIYWVIYTAKRVLYLWTLHARALFTPRQNSLLFPLARPRTHPPAYMGVYIKGPRHGKAQGVGQITSCLEKYGLVIKKLFHSLYMCYAISFKDNIPILHVHVYKSTPTRSHACTLKTLHT